MLAKNILDSREIALLMFALKADISDRPSDIIELIENLAADATAGSKVKSIEVHLAATFIQSG
jgi:hypothetical protein